MSCCVDDRLSGLPWHPDLSSLCADLPNNIPALRTRELASGFPNKILLASSSSNVWCFEQVIAFFAFQWHCRAPMVSGSWSCFSTDHDHGRVLQAPGPARTEGYFVKPSCAQCHFFTPMCTHPCTHDLRLYEVSCTFEFEKIRLVRTWSYCCTHAHPLVTKFVLKWLCDTLFSTLSSFF